MSHDLQPQRRQQLPRRPQPQRRPDPAGRGRSPLNPWIAVLFAGAAVIVLFVAGAAAQHYSSKEPIAADKPAVAATPTPTSKPPPGVGDAVRDGKFEFVVSRVDCSHTSLGQEHLKRTAKGRFCIVGLSVRNIADGSQFFLGHAQKAFDAAGDEFGNDEIAGIYANRDAGTFLRKLDPGERVTGSLVFDVPKTATLTTLELHDSLLSHGVRVALSGP
jgi:hypothetical protein